jgi:hypothetical protein
MMTTESGCSAHYCTYVMHLPKLASALYRFCISHYLQQTAGAQLHICARISRWTDQSLLSLLLQCIANQRVDTQLECPA